MLYLYKILLQRVANVKNNYMRLCYKVRSVISKVFFEKKKHLKMQSELKNNDFTIIASNCVGGMVYSDFNLKFRTPTINLYLDAKDFIKFCKNLRYYLAVPLKEIESNHPYPLAQLDDLTLHMVHYATFEEAENKWEERKQRVNYDNLFVIGNDRDGFHDGMLEEFNEIPYKKIMFSHKDNKTYKWCCYLPEARNLEMVPELTLYASIFGEKYYDKHFDFAKWLNGAEVHKCYK